jgi:glycosyltransferase involved in cell wall biosynthesis
MDFNNLVSVIIPLYNREPYIKRALDSVLGQTFQNFEIIVVDGNSVDKGPAVVKEYRDPRVTFFLQEGTGVSAARNQGVARAKGDMIAFLDADDEWSPHHLAVLIRLREKYPDAGLWATAYRKIEPGNITVIPDYQAIPLSPWEGLIPNYIQSVTYGDFPFITSGVGISKKIFLEMGGFLPGVSWNEDIELWLRIIMKYPVAFSWDGVIFWHCEAENRLTGSIPFLERDPMINRAVTLLHNGKIPSKYYPYLPDFIAKYEMNRALWNIKAGKSKRARMILKECQTTLFHKRKIFLLFLSFIPFLIFKFGWKIIALLKEYLSDVLLFVLNNFLFLPPS